MNSNLLYNCARRCTMCFLVVLFAAGTTTSIVGQVVRPEIRLIQPSRHVSHDLSTLQQGKTKVAIVRSSQTAGLSDEWEIVVNDAVYQWEMLLSGLQVSYSVFDDAHLNRSIPSSVKVLILPSVESLSDKQQLRILEFMNAGGGVIASGRTGYYDELGWKRDGLFLQSAFHLQYTEALPPQVYGILQVIETRSGFGKGIAPGFRLNVSPKAPTGAVSTRSSESLGSLITYTSEDQHPFNGLTMSATGSHGAGKFLWTMFSPQHVSVDADQQNTYQLLIVNALSELTRARSVSVASWPRGKRLAMTVAALPSPGFDPVSYAANMSHFLDMIEKKKLPASFYLASDEISTYPNIYWRAIEAKSEIGTTANNDSLIRGLSFEEQRDRLATAVHTLQLPRAHGIYPPGGFIDANFIRAMHALGAAYVIGIDEPRRVPTPIDWWNYADYRDAFQDGFTEASGPAETLDLEIPISDYPDLSIVPLATSFGSSFKRAYKTYLGQGGYLVLPFYPEQSGPFSNASKELDEVLTRAAEDDVWIATASDAVIWWRKRENVTTRIESSHPNELNITVENSLQVDVEGVVIDIELHLEANQQIEYNGSQARLKQNDSDSSVRLNIRSLAPGTNRFTLSWKR